MLTNSQILIRGLGRDMLRELIDEPEAVTDSRFAVAIVRDGVITSLPYPERSLRTAIEYAEFYNEGARDDQAIVMRNPISRGLGNRKEELEARGL